MSSRELELSRNHGGPVKNHPGKLTSYALITTCVVSVMGGLIFFYGISMLDAVTSMDMEASTKKKFCKLDRFGLTMFTSSLYLAALLASMGALWVAETFDRKKCMAVGGVVFLVGAAINAAAQSIAMLILFIRVCLGIGVGFSICHFVFGRWILLKIEAL